MVEFFFAVSIPTLAAGDLTINNSSVKGILVLIEPDDSVRDALTLLLQGEGWRVNGLAACAGLLPVLAQGPVVAVISEAHLPDCAPHELLELCSGQGLPIIFTGHDLPLQGAVDLIRQGAMDFLDKPFPQSRLLDLLERLYNRQND